MELNLRLVAEYIRGAATEELLDRVTVYRADMEPAALDLMEGELDRRGITREQIAEHDAKQRTRTILLPNGSAMRCSFCNRPAVCQARKWHWFRPLYPYLPILIPLYPFQFAFCTVHRQPSAPNPPDEYGS